MHVRPALLGLLDHSNAQSQRRSAYLLCSLHWCCYSTIITQHASASCIAGPCVAMDTACSSSLVATHLAHRGLLDGETSAALASGINLMLLASTFTHLAQLGALSSNGRSKSFEASADGYGRGEACISVVLRRGSSAGEAETHAVLAVLQGVHKQWHTANSCAQLCHMQSCRKVLIWGRCSCLQNSSPIRLLLHTYGCMLSASGPG